MMMAAALPQKMAFFAGRGQVARCERDHHGVIARQDDIGQDDRSQRKPERAAGQQFHGKTPRIPLCSVQAADASLLDIRMSELPDMKIYRANLSIRFQWRRVISGYTPRGASPE
jgi:hypothetical protein